MSQIEAEKSRSIHLLRDSVARKIAAGEVIDRPFSLLRELLDNAVDSGARSIEVHLSGGGTKSVRLVDDGCGMGEEDLKLCYLPHATSKISEVEDLEKIVSLGFRGEALSSIAACSRLRITSSTGGETAHTLLVENGTLLALEPSMGRKGTVVEASDLFYSIPARKRFLKSDQAELGACRKLFLEKAAAFPELQFKLFSEGEMKLFLPPGDPLSRLAQAYPGQVQAPLFHRVTAEGETFKATAWCSGLSLQRKDRRFIHIYVNHRKIDEYSLVQAVEHGYGEYLPGGSFPICFLFIESDPEQVDFNIHPAKREVRFRNLKAIHHQVSSSIRAFLRETWPTPPRYEAKPYDLYAEAAAPRKAAWTEPRTERVSDRNRHFYDQYEAAKSGVSSEKHDPSPPGQQKQEQEQFRYLGQVFGLFLAVEKEGVFYLIDQHAAHERILYDAFTHGPDRRQNLLVPRELSLDPESSLILEEKAGKYRALGIDLVKNHDGKWLLTALPESCIHLEKEISSFIESQEAGEETVKERLFADLSCKAAVKDGEYLPPEAARRLVSETFSLTLHRCPHGRPVYFAVDRSELFRHVGRT
jgi:DNA mismatch repair protein MutL